MSRCSFFSPCLRAIITLNKTAKGLAAGVKKMFLWGAAGRDSNLAVILREIVGQSSELAYDVVFCRVVTVRNRDDCCLDRVHLDIFSGNRDRYAFPWKDEEICG